MRELIEFCNELNDAVTELSRDILLLLGKFLLAILSPIWIFPYRFYKMIKEMKEETNSFSSHFPAPYGRSANESFEIKPCPFCGGIAHLHIHDRYGIECEDCGMGLGCIKDTPEEAIEAWNRRADNG